MITVVTPFKRVENKDLLIKVFQGKCHWIVLQADTEPIIEFPEWVTVKRLSVVNTDHISNRLFNEFIAAGLDPDMQYMLLNDDDSVEDGFFEKIPNAPVVYVSMKRGDVSIPHIVWDNWAKKECHFEDGVDVLLAHPDNMKVARVGGEQLIVKGDILKNFRYGLADSKADLPGDGRFAVQIFYEYHPVMVPDAYVLFNYFEDGRFMSFKRRPQVLFVGDFHCSGRPAMGNSEWEGNIWASLEATGLADVARFHFDKYYYHTGARGDAALLERIDEIKPDLIVLVLYKPLGSDPTVLTQATLEAINHKPALVVAIWGDLEAEEQVRLAREVEPYVDLMVGTASKAVVEGLGYTYLHVPKDPRVFNNPGKERDIDVVFSGSFGFGREERRGVLQYLVDNGVKLLAGGSEGGDHFPVEEYADRYQRAKLAISFSQARGVNVVNARVFEVMSCGAMLLEQESEELAKLYTPFVHYVPWRSKEDLLENIRHALANPEMREWIAENGQKKTEAQYSAHTFWSTIFNKLNVK